MGNRGQNAGRVYSLKSFMDWCLVPPVILTVVDLRFNFPKAIYLVSMYIAFVTTFAILVLLVIRGRKMPSISNVVNETHKYELKTLPEAYIVVRRMNYGEELIRSEMSTKFLVGGQANGKKDNNVQGELDIQTSTVALWDFANLIVEHNITDEKDNPLDFKRPQTVRSLPGRLGKEIGECIDAWNSVEETEDIKN